MEAVEARIMMTQIVRTLYKGGMTVFDSYDISRYKGEKSIILFEQREGDEKEMKDLEVYSCSIFSKFKVLIVGTDTDENYKQFLGIVKESVQSYWEISSEGPVGKGQILNCSGNWGKAIWRQFRDTQKTFQIHAIFCKMFQKLESCGFYFLCNSYTSSRTENEDDEFEYRVDLGTLFFSFRKAN
jgi:hypothetical protein